MIPGQEWSSFNTGIVLPLTVEPFGALAMAMAFNPKLRGWARSIAGVMAVTTLVAAGICQVVVHQVSVKGGVVAPPEIVGVTSVLPVIALGLSGALAVLNGVRVDPAETSHGTSRVGVLGRIGTALGDAAATRAERFAETTRASQVVPPVPSQPDPGVEPVPVGSSQRVVPAVLTQPVLESSQPTVPAAQEVGTVLIRDEDELIRDVARLRLTTHPETGRPWSYKQIGDELKISKSKAQRLGVAAEQDLPGTVDLTQAVFGSAHGDGVGTKVNGRRVPGLGVAL
jgi:hypothetical protein